MTTRWCCLVISFGDVEHNPHTTPCPSAISLSRKEHAGEISPPPPLIISLKAVKHLELPTVGAKLAFDKQANLPVTQLNNISFHHFNIIWLKSLSVGMYLYSNNISSIILTAVLLYVVTSEEMHQQRRKNWNLENKENQDFLIETILKSKSLKSEWVDFSTALVVVAKSGEKAVLIGFLICCLTQFHNWLTNNLISCIVSQCKEGRCVICARRLVVTQIREKYRNNGAHFNYCRKDKSLLKGPNVLALDVGHY